MLILLRCLNEQIQLLFSHKFGLKTDVGLMLVKIKKPIAHIAGNQSRRRKCKVHIFMPDHLLRSSVPVVDIFIKLSDSEKAKWDAKLQPLTDKWVAGAKKKGLPARDIVDDIKRLIDKHSM